MSEQTAQQQRLTAAIAHDYRIERELGRGGMATVYLAEDLRHERRVAIKVLRPELAVALGPERFLLEIKLTARLDHPHILPLLDSGQADGFLYYVMPYVEGETLRDRLNRERQLPTDEAIRFAREVADALDYAHEHDVIHRDIKPENILLSDHHARVADFGVARAIGVAGGDRITVTGLAVGTPHYMSPEQATGDREVDRRCDVYSLGAVVYEMLAGEPPHSGPTAQSILARIMTSRPRPLREVRRTLSGATDAVVQRALATNPGDRFATAAEFAAELAASTTETTAGSPERRKPSRVRMLATAVAALLVLFLGWWAFPGQQSARAGQINRIAVLPLENLTGDSAQEYFAVGMTEAVITNLGQVGLNVLSRQSVGRLTAATERLPEVARTLNVDAVVVGSVFRSADRLRVDVRFVDGATEGQIWGESFDTPLTAGNVFDIQSEIAAEIASALRLEMTPATRARLKARPTNDVRALTAVQRGVFHWQEGDSPDDFALSKRYFQEAIGLDSSYADAWNGLATVQSYTVGIGVSAYPQQDLREAKIAVQRALEIDSLTVGIGGFPVSARGILGYIKMFEWDFEGAADEFRRVVEEFGEERAGPYHVYLSMIGRHDDAIRIFEDRLVQDPLSPFLRTNLIASLWSAGEFERGLEELDRLPSEIRDVLAVGFLVRAGRVEEGLATLERLYRRPQLLNGGRFRSQGAAGIALAIAAMTEAGDTEEARRHFERFRSLFGPETRPAAQWAAAYLGLGEIDRALEVLREALVRRDPHLAVIGQAPELDGLRGLAEFHAILDEIGVPNARRN